MFASLNGKVIEIAEDSCTLDVSGVGYLIYCAPNLLYHIQVGEAKLFYIQTIVKEDSITLYGFTDNTFKKLFNLLITVQGVGPRIAMAIISTFNANQITQAILVKDIDTFKQVSGIGLKVAQRLVNELFDKIKNLSNNAIFINTMGNHLSLNENIKDASTALLALGYSASQITTAIDKLQADIKDLKVEDVIKRMLKYFAASM